jgi:hypothetical protein
MPEKGQKFVFVRMREVERNMTLRSSASEAGGALMRTATTVEASGGFRGVTDFVVEAESSAWTSRSASLPLNSQAISGSPKP